MNVFGQNIIQELAITENINISISEYQLRDQPEDKKTLSPDRDSVPRIESLKLTLVIELQNPSLITGVSLGYANTDLAVSSFKFLDLEGYSHEENKIVKLAAVKENSQKDSGPTILQSSSTIKISGYGVCKNEFRISFLVLKNNLRDLTQFQSQFESKRKDRYRKTTNPLDDLKSDESENFDGEMLYGEPTEQEEPDDIYEWKTIFMKCFESLQIFGYPLYSSPGASHVVSLLNIANVLKRSSRIDDSIEAEILLGLSLINARRYLQAVEILRKISDYYVKKQDSKSDKIKGKNSPMDNRKSQQIVKSSIDGGQSFFSSTSYIMKAAKIEIIISDAIIQPSMITNKVEALQRAVEYYSGQKNILLSKLSQNYDVFSSLTRLYPPLCKLLVKCLNDKLEPLRIASIKTIEFLMDSLGCTMGPSFPNILKNVLLTYPNQGFIHLNSNREGFAINDFVPLDVPLTNVINHKAEDKDSRTSKQKHNLHSDRDGLVYPQNAASTKAMIDIYNHLLENLLNSLSSIPPQTLHLIFNDIILPNIFVSELNNELRNYFFRITEKIINLCEGDLIVNVSFYANLLNCIENLQQNNLKNSGIKLWDVVKSKLIANMENKHLNKYLDWISESLYSLAENDALNINSSVHFQYLLDLIALICSRERNEQEDSQDDRKSKFSRKVFYIKEPLEIRNLTKPLLFWLEKIVANDQSKIELFKSLWVVLIELITCTNPKSNLTTINEISLPLLWKVYHFCKTSSPPPSMLNFLVIVLSSIKEINEPMKDFLKEFIPIFAECIPHSIYDESFTVFDILVRLSSSLLDEAMLLKCITSLLDQYTMKGKAQKRSKQFLIEFLISQTNSRDLKNNLFYTALKICLLENLEPFEDIDLKINLFANLSHSSSIIPPDSKLPRAFDSKQFNRLHETFQEKLNFAYDILSNTLDMNFPVLYLLVVDGSLQSVLEKLLSSGNSKVRLKGMEILKAITDTFIAGKDFKIVPVNEKNVGNIIEESSAHTIPEFNFVSESKNSNNLTILKIVFTKFAFSLLRLGFDTFQDSKVQFYCLSLLNLVFQTFLPSPNLKSEIEKINSKKIEENIKIDLSELENLSPYSTFTTPLTSEACVHFRLNYILKFWPFVQNLGTSTWPNIKHLSFLLLCSWVKPDASYYVQSYQKYFKQFLFTLLINLLSSKEYEMRYWGLMILGSLCGMNHNFETLGERIYDNFRMFQRMSDVVSLAIWEIVFDIQKDWNTTNRDAAIVLIQLAAPKESIKHFYRLKKEGYTLKHNLQPPNIAQNVQEFSNKFNNSTLSQYSTGRDIKNNSNLNFNDESFLNFSNVLKNINSTNFNFRYESPSEMKNTTYELLKANMPDVNTSQIGEFENNSPSFKSVAESVDHENSPELFWLEYSNLEVLNEALSIFRVDEKNNHKWLDQLNEQNYLPKTLTNGETGDEGDEKYYLEADEVDTGQSSYKHAHSNLIQKFNKGAKNWDEDIDFEDLGIIELGDDEDWIDYVDEREDRHGPNRQSRLRQSMDGYQRPGSNIKHHGASPNRRNEYKTFEDAIHGTTKSAFNSGTKLAEENAIREEIGHPGSIVDKMSLRPHNPIYRPLTPPIKNPGGKSNKLPVSPKNEYEDYEIDDDEEEMLSSQHKAQNESPLPMFTNSNLKKTLRASPSSPNLGIVQGNNQKKNDYYERQVQQKIPFYDRMDPPVDVPYTITDETEDLGLDMNYLDSPQSLTKSGIFKKNTLSKDQPKFEEETKGNMLQKFESYPGTTYDQHKKPPIYNKKQRPTSKGTRKRYEESEEEEDIDYQIIDEMIDEKNEKDLIKDERVFQPKIETKISNVNEDPCPSPSPETDKRQDKKSLHSLEHSGGGTEDDFYDDMGISQTEEGSPERASSPITLSPKNFTAEKGFSDIKLYPQQISPQQRSPPKAQKTSPQKKNALNIDTNLGNNTSDAPTLGRYKAVNSHHFSPQNRSSKERKQETNTSKHKSPRGKIAPQNNQKPSSITPSKPETRGNEKKSEEKHFDPNSNQLTLNKTNLVKAKIPLPKNQREITRNSLTKKISEKLKPEISGNPLHSVTQPLPKSNTTKENIMRKLLKKTTSNLYNDPSDYDMGESSEKNFENNHIDELLASLNAGREHGHKRSSSFEKTSLLSTFNNMMKHGLTATSKGSKKPRKSSKKKESNEKPKKSTRDNRTFFPIKKKLMNSNYVAAFEDFDKIQDLNNQTL